MMDSGFYVAMTGAKEAMTRQIQQSNNLANSNTPGFLADLIHAEAREFNTDGLISRVASGTGEAYADLHLGALVETGRDLDCAVVNDGFFAVQTSNGEGYSRRGDFNISSTGTLVNGVGQPVLGQGGLITIPEAQSISIGEDGTVSYIPRHSTTGTSVTLDRLKLVKLNSADVQKDAQGVLHLKPGTNYSEDVNIKVIQGFLNGSNVNSVGAMLDIISEARNFELHVKTMEKMEDNDAASARMLQLNG